MDILQIQFFLSAAIAGNFTAAAIENNISQSSFSKHIMSLENELGTNLFFRDKKSIRLTPAGERFQKHAYTILSSYKCMTDDMADFSRKSIAYINIHSIPVIVQYKIPQVIIEFHALHPYVSFNITEGESSNVLNGMRRMECDFAILRTDFLDSNQYNMIPINVDRLVAVLPESHPLAKEERISLRCLKGEKFLFPTDKASLFNICMLACTKAGFTPDVPYTVSGKPEISFEIVRKEDAICLAMGQVVNYFQMSGCKIVQLEEEYLSTTALVYLKSRVVSSICRKFISFVKKRQNEEDAR